MSISGAFANALSGLAAAAKRSDIISGNVANAMTEGYARQEVQLSAAVLEGRGAGVRIERVTRATDPRATADRRAAQAESAARGVTAKAQSRMSAVYGESGQAGALPQLAATLETALRRLADTPESEPLQAAALQAAKGLARGVAQASAEFDRIRMDADAAIAREVETVNDALSEIERLNAEIKGVRAIGGSTAALEQQRQVQVDKIASIVPVRTVARDGDALALYTANGAVLLDGRARRLEFTPTGMITPDMTLSSGALSGLSIDGRAIAAGREDESGPLDGGSLGAHFYVRDVLGPEAHAQIDALAADLIARFEDSSADPTITLGAAGLFTDAGGPLDPSDLVGLAGRIAVNAQADPDNGGELWRLRDGLYASAPGDAAEDDVLRALVSRMTELRTPDAASLVFADVGFSDLAARAAAVRAAEAGAADEAQALSAGRHEMFAEAEAAVVGVDTDEEMAALMLVEQAYAANARVLEVTDSLIKMLMEI
ncbi:flagellar hook-associated protein FlgK [Oceanicella actignis]|uniref:Flagellar hook-associated protein 1 n=1 Tax=Oceanicella actignis TaxID=1189325 RepID=A0A1M7T660_9RHOB|nr:flagellar hook-associated protein FlgK [Oceanicella actignis]SET44132.1 flagellar hook-associated protein 1 FlgK [Oceanicella actignis]SHN66175.1 flagellar hook-associated protein 1 FlgK [Oceanicella actignis]